MSHGALAATMAIALALAACEREQRRFEKPPTPSTAGGVQLGGIRPGPAPAPGTPSQPRESARGEARALAAASPRLPYERNAWEVNEGKRLFRWYNCNACHGAGGGNMGPALMDAKWLYGGAAHEIVATILQGRPNGMPSFSGRIPEAQAWQIASYIRSMSGQLRTDVAPGRADSISPGKPELRRDQEAPKNATPAQSAQQ